MPGRLADKVAIVTGGGGGIGRATVDLFVREGASVVVVDADEGAARKAAADADPGGQRTLALVADLGREDECERVVRETVGRFGRLDVLVNNAGVRVYGPITEASTDSWDFILRVNLLAAAYCSKFAVPEMARVGGGTIVNVSSTNAVVGRPNMVQYDATKAALLAITRDMACDHADQKIRVNAICPGSTVTTFHIRRQSKLRGITQEEAETALWREGYANIMKRKGEPIEIAYGILFLAGPESSFVNGTALMVDGGMGITPE